MPPSYCVRVVKNNQILIVDFQLLRLYKLKIILIYTQLTKGRETLASNDAPKARSSGSIATTNITMLNEEKENRNDAKFNIS